MGHEGPPERAPWALPPKAEVEWHELRRQLEEVGPVACQIGDPTAWWPDRCDVAGPATHGAVAACRRCPAAAPCLAYALAADERYGIWGGTLPGERRVMRWEAARASDSD